MLSWRAVTETTRRYERIEIERPVRLFIQGDQGLDFEAFCTTRNMGLGGLFLESTFLMPEGLELTAELGLPDGPLPIRSRVAHRVGQDDRTHLTGMGIEFLDVNARGREALLRYFTPKRYERFYADFAAEFPHLKGKQPLRDVSLVLNLWEEWKIRQGGGPAATASGAPPAPSRRPGEAEAAAARRVPERPASRRLRSR
jgi:hypothetical protein